MAQFLVAGGHEKIAYIAGWEGASTQRDREAGFRAGLAEQGSALFAREVGNFDSDQARHAANVMFGVPAAERPDAVFVANDHMAFAVMDELRFGLGLKVPEHVSVVAFDDVPPSSWRAYDLTTMRQRANLMVTETVDALMAHIENPSKFKPRTIAIKAPLIIRGSARVPENWPDEEGQK